MAIALEELRELTPRPPLRLVPAPVPAGPLGPVAVPVPTARRRAAQQARFRRRRLAAAALLIAVVVGASLAIGRAGADVAVVPAEPVAEVTVVISPGETLWAVAQANLPAGERVADYAAAIAAHNGVDARQVQPGDVVRLP